MMKLKKILDILEKVDDDFYRIFEKSSGNVDVGRFTGFVDLVDYQDELNTLDMCVRAVSLLYSGAPFENSFSELAQYIPKEFLTAEFYVKVARERPELLEDADFPTTGELCRTVVKHNWSALNYVPENLKTPGLCLLALRGHGSALEYVPENLKTPGLCLLAVGRHGYALKYVPENLKTPELCRTAVVNTGWSLRYVPDHKKTFDLCLAAVMNDETALEYVPPELAESVRKGLLQE